MKRKSFLTKMAAAVPLTFATMKLNALNKLVDDFENTAKMPVLFLGHGSPMNAIEENKFVQGFRNIASEIETPKAILCVSAHWETLGTQITAMENPRTIHDFGGFPRELYQVQYPAPGSPQLAKETIRLIRSTPVELDDKWGLDHGAWSVIKHLYPLANIPVIQLSLDRAKSPEQHYQLAKELNKLREKGILIIGSGNLVHNLGRIAWDKLDQPYAFDWAEEARTNINRYILQGDHKNLVNFRNQGRAFDLSIPTPEHFLPLLYALGLQGKNDSVQLFNDEPLGGSLTMTSVKIG